MRIHVTFIDRIGITQEVLALLVARNLNLDAVEMVPPNVYIDAPALDTHVLDELRQALRDVRGVQDIQVVGMLPGQQRRLQLDALLHAMPDPLMAVDGDGKILMANPALISLVGFDPEGRFVGELFDAPELQAAMLKQHFRLPMREIIFNGQSLLIDVMPVAETLNADGSQPAAGALLTLYAPSRLGERLAALHPHHAESFEALLGDSTPIRTLKARGVRVAALDAPLLIQGETGTGKELVARACHAASPRSNAPFLTLSCAALPENQADGELFGYAPGTANASQRSGKPGLLELANGGTVFLDEIAEMSPYLQAKLMHFLSEGSFRRVGGEREIRVDVRILSATHRNLEQLVGDGAFREDLFYRLNVLNLSVPPLRERSEDILLLARHFLLQACTQIQRPPCRLAPSTYPALLGNNWPGNVRQLQNIIFRAAAMSDSTIIGLDDLDIARTRLACQEEEIPSLSEAMEAFERSILERFYASHPSTRLLASRLKSSHSAIAMRLRKYGIGGHR
ncbi:sigma-54-dependent transcriptional regulator [Stutzerimonas stutzeri]|uniref:sigma-54-dependent transcriptional regulator n=1 Tax=Stutzerimonas stutzeri TaxID=316 RepID=UPI002108FBA2|nr:sigma-54-dependent transcriptional regulator [Stutzerimonas stutzeri]MCQ4243032.1 sigma-54-dependent transcriptional regulator [Stutzerimonas stutzeri]